MRVPCSKSLVSQVERGVTPVTPWFVGAVARALNLPFFCFLRVNLLHGPLATTSLLVAFETHTLPVASTATPVG